MADILMVSQNIPSPNSGAGSRNYHLLKALAANHSVSLLALGGYLAHQEAQDASALKDLTAVSRVITPPRPAHKRWQQVASLAWGKPYAVAVYTLPPMQEAIDDACARHQYDVVLFESVLMAGYRIPRGLPVIIDQHNIEYEIRLRTYKVETALVRKYHSLLEGILLKPVELQRCRRADAVVVTSERERLLLQDLLPTSFLAVVPNGVDVSAPSDDCLAAPEIPGRITFIGSMGYYPNVQAVHFFAERCWPLVRAHVPDATWRIVGMNPPPDVCKLGELPGVTVTGSVPDVRPHLASASVAIAPLLAGSGTRLKILEALAMRKATVSTSLGCEGLSVVAGEHLEIADAPEAFARAVVALLRDPCRRQALGSAGRALVEAEYAWERCGAAMLRVVDRFVQQRAPNACRQRG